MRPTLSIAAFVAFAGFSSATPNGWSKTVEAEDGPNKLDDCGCAPIYEAMQRCQKLKWPKGDTEECVCIKNPDGWYGYMDLCRNCLSNGDDGFFKTVSKHITQLFVSCTNVGGAVTSDGNSICASNAYGEACVSLAANGKSSWASFEDFDSDTVGNSTYKLDLVKDNSSKDEGEDESTSATGSATKKTTATTAIDTASTDEASGTAVAVTTSTGEASSASTGSSGKASETESQAGAATPTTAPSSAAVVGIVNGWIMAVVIGAVLF
ncbi:hypothetical protein NW762_011291 [Fusarium torreyae]|uniref:Extracellular membrane protein CFEM domain-containing protein n=1 Tax=Fusarium torreyae TaxID=1237075 RepID=A0A9W8RRL5_9HYPO|nr:hypothetical protein NW762_011291 [Fusarium torreyae]